MDIRREFVVKYNSKRVITLLTILQHSGVIQSERNRIHRKIPLLRHERRKLCYDKFDETSGKYQSVFTSRDKRRHEARVGCVQNFGKENTISQ